MKRMIEFASQIRGFLRNSLSTLSKGRAIQEKIIDKIEHNQMNRSHWKERQKMLAKSKEDVPEVRRDRHLDVLGHIGIDLAAFNQTFFKDHQVLIRRMTSAVSLAISTAVSTEIPTSETFMDGASLIPSPM